MQDLISKLSEIRSKYNCFDDDEAPFYRALSEAIRILSKRADGDTISRAAALDAIKKSRFLVDAMEKVIKLPSAQPEVIRCKDCKWKYRHNCTRAVEVFIDDDKYCSWAERKDNG